MIHTLYRWGRAVLFAVLSPLAEKNPARFAMVDTPFVFSMSRVIVACFSYGMFRQLQYAGIAGWPEATLCIALVYAIPILDALSKVSPQEVLAFGKAIIDRLGIGEVRQVGNLMDPRLPSKHDDERGEHTEREDVG